VVPRSYRRMSYCLEGTTSPLKTGLIANPLDSKIGVKPGEIGVEMNSRRNRQWARIGEGKMQVPQGWAVAVQFGSGACSTSTRSSLAKSGALRRLPWFRVEQLEHPLPKVALHERVYRAVRVEHSDCR